MIPRFHEFWEKKQHFSLSPENSFLEEIIGGKGSCFFTFKVQKRTTEVKSHWSNQWTDFNQQALVIISKKDDSPLDVASEHLNADDEFLVEQKKDEIG